MWGGGTKPLSDLVVTSTISREFKVSYRQVTRSLGVTETEINYP